MFEGFEEFELPTSGTTIRGRRGGTGPPVLLLHGFPQTHLMWHRVAPGLAEHFTVVATDLRGFGDSGKPDSAADHSPYSMREIARDQVEVMEALGYRKFAVVGHDRGARCAYRMALDHPERIDRLAVLDIVPTGDAFDRAGRDFSLGYWVWSFLAAPEPIPETLIGGAPDVFVGELLDGWSTRPDVFDAEVRAQYIEKFRDPATVHAICEEYRAAATLDHEHDRLDRADGRRITCPVLALWDPGGAVAQWYDPLEIWREWATDLSGGAVGTGHFFAEEAPDATLERLLAFLL
ncbi:alpha/beta fold hydrolase [Kribbella monticola]|uniref:alpha/beta fold hydrolase n=1 Tax=Kribbella monticola TaxID=2185285 RepID=UPI000DD344A5|nr:alpha/beta hydrolase [Kribbella monticola]